MEQAAEQLAARLLYLTQQEKAIKKEKDEVKDVLNKLHKKGVVATKTDIEVLFSDGAHRKIRLQKVATGTYFKVADDYKDEYTAESHQLQEAYLTAGKAEMAEKAPSWRVQEVK